LDTKVEEGQNNTWGLADKQTNEMKNKQTNKEKTIA
jgi:hypothetical protein